MSVRGNGQFKLTVILEPFFPAPPSSSIVPPSHYSPPDCPYNSKWPYLFVNSAFSNFYSLLSMPTSIRVLSSKSFIYPDPLSELFYGKRTFLLLIKPHSQPHCFFLVQSQHNRVRQSIFFTDQSPGYCSNEWLTRSNSTFLFLKATNLTCMFKNGLPSETLLCYFFNSFAIMTSKTYG